MSRSARTFPRYLAPRLREALRDSPAVLIHGPRQSGKTTLARAVGEPRGYRYVSFDDEAICAAARGDPIGFVSALPAKTILDEVQRVPEIFTSLKAAIDGRRTAGRFILTGSANILFVPALADSLAGRMAILRLHPLAQCEIGSVRPRVLLRHRRIHGVSASQAMRGSEGRCSTSDGSVERHELNYPQPQKDGDQAASAFNIA
jgi:predicted AAA+ superfamily ATPase